MVATAFRHLADIGLSLGRFTLLEEGSSVSQATHILVPSETGPFSFLRCMMLKIVQFPNLWAEDWAMFSSWRVGSRKSVAKRGTTHSLIVFSLRRGGTGQH